MPGKSAGPIRGPRLRRAGDGQPRREFARVLADRRAVAPALRGGAGPLVRPPPRARREHGSSANLLAASALTSPTWKDRRLRPGRRGDHGGRRLPDHRRADHPERGRAGLRRRDACPTYNIDVTRLEEARSRADPRGHGGAHARQPVRPRRGDRVLQEARPLAGRGQLRRVGLVLSGKEDRDLRRPRHAQLLPASPHDHGRGRRGALQDRGDEAGRRKLPRLGARLLVRPRASTTPAASASAGSSANCPRATTTSTSTAISATT